MRASVHDYDAKICGFACTVSHRKLAYFPIGLMCYIYAERYDSLLHPAIAECFKMFLVVFFLGAFANEICKLIRMCHVDDYSGSCESEYLKGQLERIPNLFVSAPNDKILSKSCQILLVS